MPDKREKEQEGGCIEKELERKGKKTGKIGKTKCGREREKKRDEREEKMGKKKERKKCVGKIHRAKIPSSMKK